MAEVVPLLCGMKNKVRKQAGTAEAGLPLNE